MFSCERNQIENDSVTQENLSEILTVLYGVRIVEKADLAAKDNKQFLALSV